MFGIKNRSVFNATILSIALMLALLTKKQWSFYCNDFWLLLLAIDIFKKETVASGQPQVLFDHHVYGLHTFYILDSQPAIGCTSYHCYNQNKCDRRRNLCRTTIHRSMAEDWLWIVEGVLYNGDMEYLLFAIAGLFYYKSVFKEARVKRILPGHFITVAL